MPVKSLRLLFMRLPVDPDVSGRPHQPAIDVWPSAVLVAAGGAVGALSRAGIETANPPSGGWPWGTLIINISGAAALAVLLVILEERFPLARIPRPLIGTGMLGGYTTFSTFAVETVQMAHAGRAPLAVAYVAVSTLGAVAAAVGGAMVGRSTAGIVNRRSGLRRLRRVSQPDPEDAP